MTIDNIPIVFNKLINCLHCKNALIQTVEYIKICNICHFFIEKDYFSEKYSISKSMTNNKYGFLIKWYSTKNTSITIHIFDERGISYTSRNININYWLSLDITAEKLQKLLPLL